MIYDLEDGSGFYEESGFKEYCGDKLNPKWFMLTQSPEAEGAFHGEDEEGMNGNAERDQYVDGHLVHSVNPFTAETTFGAMLFLVMGFAVISLLRRCGSEIRNKEGLGFQHRDTVYGAV